MSYSPESLRYHGLRSVEELLSALDADSFAGALAHKELSRLHLDRFLMIMRDTANGICEPGTAGGKQASRPRPRERDNSGFW